MVLTRAEVSPILQEHIETSNIPDMLGGDLQFEHGMAPMIDDNMRTCLDWKFPGTTLPLGPIKLSENPNGTIRAMAVGSLDGVQRRETLFQSA